MSSRHRRPNVPAFDEIGIETRDLLDRFNIAKIEDVQPIHQALLQDLFLAKIAPLEWLLPKVHVRVISDSLLFSSVGDPLIGDTGCVIDRAAYANGEFAGVSLARYYETPQASYTIGAMLVIDGEMIDEGSVSSGQIAVPLDGRASISFISKAQLHN